jgi:hypothetical protein
MHAALARLVNNEETRKQEKINIPKRSSREAELSPRGAAPRLVKRPRPPAITAAPPPADAWPVPAPPSQPVPQKRTLSGKPPLAFPPSPAQSPRQASPDSVMDTLSTSFLRSCSTDALPIPKDKEPERPAARSRTLDGYGQFLFLDDDAKEPCALGPGLPQIPRERAHTA